MIIVVINMNRKIAAITFVVALTALTLTGHALAQELEIGVSKGESFVYGITAQWSSTNASDTIPPSLIEINSTVSYNVTVTSVQYPNVTATVSWSFSNGTSTNNSVNLDVDSGAVTYTPNLPVFEGFYYANLNAGDPLRPGGSLLTINRTLPFNDPTGGGARLTNLVSFSFSVTNPSTIGSQTTTYYIDKITGALVERIDQAVSVDPISGSYQTATETWTLKQTNAWSPQTQTPSPSPSISSPSPTVPEMQTWLLPLLLATATLLLVGLRIKFKPKAQ